MFIIEIHRSLIVFAFIIKKQCFNFENIHGNLTYLCNKYLIYFHVVGKSYIVITIYDRHNFSPFNRIVTATRINFNIGQRIIGFFQLT